jgi:hypothetical protein
MEQLMFSAPLDAQDFLLAQSSRGRVGQLSLVRGVVCSEGRDGFSFEGSSKALHRLLNFR